MSIIDSISDNVLIINLSYWTFIGLIAVHVTPWILALLFLVPGYASGDTVEVDVGDISVDVSAKSGTLDEQHIKKAVMEATELNRHDR